MFEEMKRNASAGEMAMLIYYEHLLKTTKPHELHIKLSCRMHHILESAKHVYEYQANIPFFLKLFSTIGAHCQDTADLNMQLRELSMLQFQHG
jgi:hypothetical protein